MAVSATRRMGLKLFAANVSLYKKARQLVDDGLFEYIELFTPPDSEHFLSVWADGTTSYVIHGPHFANGVNWADKNLRQNNRTAFATAQRYADALHAAHIIVHGGAFGPVEEVAQQLHAIIDAGENRVLLENTPQYGLGGESLTVFLPSQMTSIQEYVGHDKLGFVLDIGHAIYAANSVGYEHMSFLEQFLKLHPAMYHLSDGDSTSKVDLHLNIGKGDFNLGTILASLPSKARVTLETPKDLAMQLEDTRCDVAHLKVL